MEGNSWERKRQLKVFLLTNSDISQEILKSFSIHFLYTFEFVFWVWGFCFAFILRFLQYLYFLVLPDALLNPRYFSSQRVILYSCVGLKFILLVILGFKICTIKRKKNQATVFFSDAQAPSSWFCHYVLNFLSYKNKNLPIILDVDRKHNELKSISLEKKKNEKRKKK